VDVITLVHFSQAPANESALKGANYESLYKKRKDQGYRRILLHEAVGIHCGSHSPGGIERRSAYLVGGADRRLGWNCLSQFFLQ
jgi:hypothetical protein